MKKNVKDNNKLKASLFFGFYFFFFLFLVIYIRNNNITFNNNDNKNNNDSIEENKVIKKYSIDYLDNDFEYEFIINDNDEVIKYKGTKNNIDYEDYEYKYFLNIYNINQIIKNSKFLSNENNILNYEISNVTLSELYDKEITDGISKINVYVNDNKNLEKVILDLSTFINKDKYIITLNYKVVDKSE